MYEAKVSIFENVAYLLNGIGFFLVTVLHRFNSGIVHIGFVIILISFALECVLLFRRNVVRKRLFALFGYMILNTIFILFYLSGGFCPE